MKKGSGRRRFNLNYSLTGKVSPKELGIFCGELSVMLGAGVGIISCLKVLGGEGRKSPFCRDILSVMEKIKRGSSMSSAAAAYPKSFPPLFVSMVKAGEIGGSLDEIFKDLSGYFEEEADIRNRLFSAILYPFIVLIVAAAVIIFLIVTVVPIFVSIFESMGTDVPLMTRILLEIGRIFKFVIPIFILIIISLAFLRKKSPPDSLFRLRWDAFVLRLSGIGKTVYDLECVRFTKALSILLGNGVELMTSLKAAESIISNAVIRREFSKVRSSVRSGGQCSDLFKNSEIFEPEFYQMIRVGEQSGTLAEIFSKISDYYRTKGERNIKTFMTIFEPVVMIIVGLIVLFIVLSIMMPIYQIYQDYTTMLY